MNQRLFFVGMVALMVMSLLLASCTSTATPTTVPTATPPAISTSPIIATPTQQPAPTSAGAGSPTPTPKPTATTAPTATPTAKPVPKGTLTVALSTLGDEVLDPGFIRVGFVQAYFESIFDTLVGLDRDGNVTPRLATSWTISKDGLAWDFQIRQGVKFHNGDSLTANDVKFSFDRMISLKGPKGIELGNILDRVETKGDYEVVVYTKQPYPALLSSYLGQGMSYFYVVPKSYIEKVGDAEFAKRPVGSGPFTYVENAKLDHMTLKAFTDYWGGSPQFDTLVLKVVPEASTRLAMLQTGQADIVDGMNGPPATQIAGTKGLRTVQQTGSGASWIAFRDFNTAGSPFADKRVRLALNYAIDKKAIVDKVLFGQATVKNSMYHPGVNGTDPKDVNPYPYDLQKAQQLMAEAGYSAGFTTTVYTTTSSSTPMAAEAAEAAVSYWAKIGVKAQTVKMDPTTFNAKIRDRSLTPAWAFTAGRMYDGGVLLEWCFGSQATVLQAADPQIDALFAQQKVETDPVKRQALLRQVQQIVWDQAYVVPIFDASAIFGVTDRVITWGLPAHYMYAIRFETIQLKS